LHATWCTSFRGHALCGRLSAIPSVLADGRSNLERYRSVPSRFGRLALQVTHGMACSQRTRFAQGRH
jgi:hypothetical protein